MKTSYNSNMTEKKSNGWMVAFWILLVIFGLIFYGDMRNVQKVNQLQSSLSLIQTKYNNLTSANNQARIQCISAAQAQTVIDPFQYGASFLQSATNTCDSEYPVN